MYGCSGGNTLNNATLPCRILEKMTNCRYRFGTTGTLTDSKTNKLVLEGLFGTTFTAVTSKQLMKDKHISELQIKCLKLKYTDKECEINKKATYQEEINFIVSHCEYMNSSVNTSTEILFSCPLKSASLKTALYQSYVGSALTKEHEQ